MADSIGDVSTLELIWLEAVVSYGIAFDGSVASRQPQFTRGHLAGLEMALHILTGEDRDAVHEDIKQRHAKITGRRT